MQAADAAPPPDATELFAAIEATPIAEEAVAPDVMVVAADTIPVAPAEMAPPPETSALTQPPIAAATEIRSFPVLALVEPPVFEPVQSAQEVETAYAPMPVAVPESVVEVRTVRVETMDPPIEEPVVALVQSATPVGAEAHASAPRADVPVVPVEAPRVVAPAPVEAPAPPLLALPLAEYGGQQEALAAPAVSPAMQPFAGPLRKGLLVTDMSLLPVRSGLIPKPAPAPPAWRRLSRAGERVPWQRLRVIAARATVPVLLASLALGLTMMDSRGTPQAQPASAAPSSGGGSQASGSAEVAAALPAGIGTETQKMLAIATTLRGEIAALDARGAEIAARGTPNSVDELVKIFGDMATLTGLYRDAYVRAGAQMRQIDTAKLPQAQTFTSIIETYEHIGSLYTQASDAARDRNATRLAQSLQEVEAYKTARAAETRSMLCVSEAAKTKSAADCR